jgi:hypothetical protein
MQILYFRGKILKSPFFERNFFLKEIGIHGCKKIQNFADFTSEGIFRKNAPKKKQFGQTVFPIKVPRINVFWGLTFSSAFFMNNFS